jgi:hypothetical protein
MHCLSRDADWHTGEDADACVMDYRDRAEAVLDAAAPLLIQADREREHDQLCDRIRATMPDPDDWPDLAAYVEHLAHCPHGATCVHGHVIDPRGTRP